MKRMLVAALLGIVVDAWPADAACRDLPEAIRQLGLSRLERPGFTAGLGHAITSLLLVVDPHQGLKDRIAAIFRERGTAAELISAYTCGGTQAFDENRLQQDLIGLLAWHNPELEQAERMSFAGLIARRAHTVAQNTLNALTAPPSAGLPTRPIAVSATSWTQQDIRVDGLRLRYIDTGPSPDSHGTLLLVHGHQSRIEEFTSLLPRLTAAYRVVIPDLPGSGYSDQPDIDYSLAFYQRTLLHFMDALGVDRAIVAGGSLGGNLALRLGREAPDRFPGVLAWSPAGVWPAQDFLAGLADCELNSGLLYWPFLRFQSQFWYRPDLPQRQELLYESMEYRREVDSPVFRRATRQIAAEELRQSHRGLGHLNRQPTLLLVGRQDTGLDLARHAIEFFQELPAAELVVFEQTGHSIHDERPAEMADALLDFLARHGL